MNIVLGLLILAANRSAPIEARHPDAVAVFHCGFEQESDAEYDGWPDGWTRKRSRDYPAYLPARIVRTPSPAGESALRIDLDGAAAAIYSPSIEIRPLFSYVLEGEIRTADLKHDRAWFSVAFYDEEHHLLASCDSERCGAEKGPDAGGWRKLRLGPVSPPGDKARYAQVGLHLEPIKPARTANATPLGPTADLRGTAWFDDVWFARLPRMSLTTNSPSNVYADPRQIEISCNVSGTFERDPTIRFELVDFAKRSVDRGEQRLSGKLVAQTPGQAAVLSAPETTQANGFAGSTTWKPAVSEPGLYQARVSMQGPSGPVLERELTLAVVVPQANRMQGEFGWSLPDGDVPLSLAALGQLLPQVGINWIKFPVWIDEHDSRRMDQVVNFAERLSSQGIEMVGLLALPPPAVREHFGAESLLSAADVFTSSADLWYASLEPVLTRLSLQVRWWQLGFDGDHSFVGYPRLAEKIATLKDQLQRYGQEIYLGIGWRTMNEPPPDKTPPWEFLALSSPPPMTAAELGHYLPALDGRVARRWVDVQPLNSHDYDLETRIADLVQRMLSAKIAGAEAIFVSQPFEPDSGLMQADGTPGELLLAWRTTALALSGAQHLGSLELPSGSHNHLFVRGDEVLMVVWNERPTEEVLYLGDDVRQIDVWGHSTRPPKSEHRQTIRVGPLPNFVYGLNGAVVRWNMAVRFEQERLPSVCGVPHENSLVIKNFFPQGIGGQARLVGPDDWKIVPRTIDFKLSAGEEVQQPFAISLPLDTTGGRRTIRIDFEVSADRLYEFSVYRRLDVGLDDVTLEASSHINERGDLEVLQQVTNHTQTPVSFKCLLFAPNRRRMMSQVIELGHDQDTKTYRFVNGEELVGQTLWLRAEEIGGQRTINFRFVAEK